MPRRAQGGDGAGHRPVVGPDQADIDHRRPFRRRPGQRPDDGGCRTGGRVAAIDVADEQLRTRALRPGTGPGRRPAASRPRCHGRSAGPARQSRAARCRPGPGTDATATPPSIIAMRVPLRDGARCRRARAVAGSKRPACGLIDMIIVGLQDRGGARATRFRPSRTFIPSRNGQRDKPNAEFAIAARRRCIRNPPRTASRQGGGIGIGHDQLALANRLAI